MTHEEYSNHDCHLTAEDSCETCEKWFEQCFDENKGGVADGILDDDMPDARDYYVAKEINEKQSNYEK